MARTFTTRRKVAISVMMAATAAAVAGLGTFGSFTATTSASEAVNSGTVSLTLADNNFATNAASIVPGDTINRQVKLVNSGDTNQASISLTTTATTSSILDTDATNGLQLSVQSCPTAWTQSAVGSGFTYSCTGTATTLVAARPVVGANIALPSIAALTAGSTSYLVVTMTLPTTADNTFQGKSSTVSFTFNGTQRAGTQR